MKPGQKVKTPHGEGVILTKLQRSDPPEWWIYFPDKLVRAIKEADLCPTSQTSS